MSKIIISEERLNAIIAKSINEALEDEGLGTRIARGLGNAAQWVQNRVNNYKNAFDAGRNKQRYANKDYDPYQGMKNADAVRNFGGDEYGQYRYNITADRNNNAATSWTNSFGTKTQNNPSNNGDRVSNYQSGRKPNAQGDVSEPGANPDSAQGQNGNQFNIQNPAQYLKQEGFQLVNGQWISSALQSQNPNIVQAAKQYQAQAQGGAPINEQKIREAAAQALRKYINENYRRR